MQMLINALLLAVLLPMGRTTGLEQDPACRADLHGSRLTTRIQFYSGYTLEAPWEILGTRSSGQGGSITADLALAQMIESDALTGEQRPIELQQPVRITLEADSQAGLIDQAARTWCRSVIQARGRAGLDRPSLPKPGRIT